MIDELMGHHAGRHGDRDGSAIGLRYRHMTAEMHARVLSVIDRCVAAALAGVPQPCPKVGERPQTAE